MRGHEDEGAKIYTTPAEGASVELRDDSARSPALSSSTAIMPAAAQVLGLDHIYLTVSSLARSEPFYDGVLTGTLGFRKGTFTLNGELHVSYFNRQFGLVLRPARPSALPSTTKVDPYAPGLHHLCLRVDSESDVDRVATALVALGISASPPRLYPEYAPDYRATFFEDPDGLRLEVTNFRAERRERQNHWEG